MYMVLSIAAGGACGAVLRHFSGMAALRLLGPDFPYGTLFVNVTGSFLMGLIIALFAHLGNPTQELRGFLTVGCLGAFTTFSTFSLDVATLYEGGHMIGAAGYVLLSVALSISALFIGMILIRALTA